MSSYIRINKKIGNFKNSIEIPGDKSISIRLIMLPQLLSASQDYTIC